MMHFLKYMGHPQGGGNQGRLTLPRRLSLRLLPGRRRIQPPPQALYYSPPVLKQQYRGFSLTLNA